MAKKSIALLTSLGVLYEHVLRKGVFALVRLKKTNGETKFQFHVDWDCDEYGDVVEQAKKVKQDRNQQDNIPKGDEAYDR